MTRRPSTASPSPAEQRAQLVRHIAADPVLTQWLRDHVAEHLERAASQLTGYLAVGLDPAQTITSRAKAHRRGETALW